MFIYAVGDIVPYFTYEDITEYVTITAVHYYLHGVRYDAVTDSGVDIAGWDGEPA